MASPHGDLASRIGASSRGSNPVTLPNGDEEWVGTWGCLYVDARNFAGSLHSIASTTVERFRYHEAGRQLTVGVLSNTSKDLVVAIEAVWLGGDTLVPLPLPYRATELEGFVEDTKSRIRISEMDLLIVDGMVGEMLGDIDLGVPTFTFDAVAHAPCLQPVSWHPGELAVLQFTSGSTSEPKAVNVTFGVLETNLRSVNERAVTEVGKTSLVSWLPLYHDMGLVGVLGSAMSRSLRLQLAGPQDYLAQPGRWMHWISQYRGEITVGPNSAYAIAARFMRRTAEPMDLSSLRVAINGAEPVSVESMNEWVAAGAVHGLDPGCVFPAFGMAEVGIAVSFPPVGRGLATETIDEASFSTNGSAVRAAPGPESRDMVLLGTPIEGVELMIGDPDTGEAVPARHVGELLLRGPSVTPGYYRDAAANAVAFRDGWLRTGDLAYLTEDGELACCGRIKDLIIMGGRNIYPQDIEASASKVDGVRAGNAAAFGLMSGDGTERTVVVVESRKHTSGEMRRGIKIRVATECGITPHTVMVVPPGTLPKTSSGKTQRFACKMAYVAGDYDLVKIS